MSVRRLLINYESPRNQWSPRAHRRPPVDPLQQHRQLRRRHRHLAPGRRRPHEAATLQTLGKQARTLAVPPDHLDQVAPASPEHEQMPAVGIRLSTCSASAASPGKPLRMSVTPLASRTRVEDGTGIIPPVLAPHDTGHPRRTYRSHSPGGRSPAPPRSGRPMPQVPRPGASRPPNITGVHDAPPQKPPPMVSTKRWWTPPSTGPTPSENAASHRAAARAVRPLAYEATGLSCDLYSHQAHALRQSRVVISAKCIGPDDRHNLRRVG